MDDNNLNGEKSKQLSIYDYWEKCVFKNYYNCKGRARRMEYFSCVLFNFLVLFIWSLGLVGIVLLIYVLLGFNTEEVAFALIATLTIVLFIPEFAVTSRRLQDLGISGVFAVILFVPYINCIMVLLLLLIDGQRGENKYGSNPKGL